MSVSIMQDPQGNEWPVGFVQVVTSGVPVNIMKNVDPSNRNAPGSPPPGAEYTPRCHRVWFQAYAPAANNNGMVANTGNIYVMRTLGPNNQNSGGPGNLSDPGAMVAILPPGGFTQLPADESDSAVISPYRYSLDADVSGEGALVVLIGCSR